jgi:hypothetical protein
MHKLHKIHKLRRGLTAMSLLPRLRLVGLKSAFDQARGYFAPARRPSKRARRPRRLCIDPLEQRQLLSVSPDPYTLTVQTGNGTTLSAQSSATDNNGDTVVCWTGTDYTYDADKGTYVADENIYAEYLTKDVQQLTLAPGTSSFTLVYGGSAITQ